MELVDVSAIKYAIVNVNAASVTSGTKEISKNGKYDITTYKEVDVEVPASQVDKGTKVIVANGEHSVVGYAKVEVNVSSTEESDGEYIINTNDVPVGTVYFRNIDNQNHSAEFGILIGEKSYLSKGIGTASTIAFLHFGFTYLKFHRIYCETFYFSLNKNYIKFL